MKLLIFLAVGVLAQASPNVLEDVKLIKEQNGWIQETAEYECLLGIQYRHKEFLNQELYFLDLDTHRLEGPILTIDIEKKQHRGILERNGLIGDINYDCPYANHFGILLRIESVQTNKISRPSTLDSASNFVVLPFSLLVGKQFFPKHLGSKLEQSNICRNNSLICPDWRQYRTIKDIHRYGFSVNQ